MATQKTHTPVPVKVQLSVSPGTADPVPGDYGAWTDEDGFSDPIVSEVLAPAVSRAKFAGTLPRIDGGDPAHAWQWKSFFKADDRLAVVKRSDASRLWFQGFIVDVNPSWNRSGEAVTVTCCGMAWRLKRDVVVYGRYMLNTVTPTASVEHFSGLPCDFNAGGKPNRCAAEDFEEIEGGPAAGVAYFMADDQDGAEFWAPADVLDYLAWRYNAAETWIANAALSEADYARTTRLVVSCEGLDLWTALAAVADADAYDVAERFDPDADGSKTSAIVINRRGSGTTAVLKRLGEMYGVTLPPMDLANHDVFDATIAHNYAGCITSPVVAGGRGLVEIGIPLGQAWDPARLELEAGAEPVPENPVKSSQFYERYCIGGAAFAAYADVGRLWDANTDGRYSAAPTSLSVPDVAALADEAEGSWPAMAHRPLPSITCLDGGSLAKENHGALVEISFDSGVTYQPLAGCRVLPDRLGIYITAPNLATIWKKDEKPDFGANYLASLIDDASKVKVRLTCTVAAPVRSISRPAIQIASAATAFSTGGWFDKGALGQVRDVAVSSRLDSLGLSADSGDYSPHLTDVAGKVQDALEAHEIEAGLAVERPDQEVHLTNVVQKLTGVEYSFQTNKGASPVYPRVVAIQRHFNAAWGMLVALDTDRKAPLR